MSDNIEIGGQVIHLSLWTFKGLIWGRGRASQTEQANNRKIICLDYFLFYVLQMFISSSPVMICSYYKNFNVFFFSLDCLGGLQYTTIPAAAPIIVEFYTTLHIIYIYDNIYISKGRGQLENSGIVLPDFLTSSFLNLSAFFKGHQRLVIKLFFSLV